MAKSEKEIEAEILKYEKKIMLERINDGTQSPILDSEESYTKSAAECIKLLGIKKNELHDRQLKAYIIYGKDILKVKDELLKGNEKDGLINLGDEIDKYLKT